MIAWLLACSVDNGAPQHGVASVYGIELGAFGPKDIEAWQEANGVSCATTPSMRRHTIRTECASPTTAVLGSRDVRGRFDELLMVRAEDGPVHHVSTRRLYSLPQAAIDDYQSTLELLRTQLGAPTTESAPPPLDKMDSTVVWVPATWQQPGLEVQLRMMKAGGATWSVSEQWDIPGVEDDVDGRTILGTAAAYLETKFRSAF